jgi:hypothetical protein
MIPLAEPDRREDLAVQAIANLRRAFSDGYTNAENLRVDTDLDALRDRDDFRALVNDIAPPVDPPPSGR